MRTAFVVTIGLAGLAVTACAEATEDAPSPTIIGDEQRRAVSVSLTGEWSCEGGSTRRRLELRDNGQFEIGSKRGSYQIDGNTLALETDESQGGRPANAFCDSIWPTGRNSSGSSIRKWCRASEPR
ncbi:MAG: hypothetical protein JSW27_14535 [Phycisphaerales bacterium]|nr:MAG: hypothetical protein JSW27_14535 [Phycisphaerales bacterium]